MSAEVVGLDVEKEDKELYELCEEWHVAVANHVIEDDNRSAICSRMDAIVGLASRITPASFRGLRGILTIAATILSARVIDPDGFVGSGDAFGLVARALKAADYGHGKID